MDYEKLKEVIAKQIKENGRREITGPVLQAVLMAMVDSLGEVYPHTYTEEQKAQARANIDALSNYDGEITKEKLSLEVQAILNDVANKQNISDATLATIAKTIVGAINELFNGGVKDKSIATSKIEDGAITEDKLASQSVTNAKIANASVSEEKITDNSVSTEKLKDGAITEPKLDTDLLNIITSAVQPAELKTATNYITPASVASLATEFSMIGTLDGIVYPNRQNYIATEAYPCGIGKTFRMENVAGVALSWYRIYYYLGDTYVGYKEIGKTVQDYTTIAASGTYDNVRFCFAISSGTFASTDDISVETDVPEKVVPVKQVVSELDERVTELKNVTSETTSEIDDINNGYRVPTDADFTQSIDGHFKIENGSLYGKKGSSDPTVMIVFNEGIKAIEFEIASLWDSNFISLVFGLGVDTGNNKPCFAQAYLNTSARPNEVGFVINKDYDGNASAGQSTSIWGQGHYSGDYRSPQVKPYAVAVGDKCRIELIDGHYFKASVYNASSGCWDFWWCLDTDGGWNNPKMGWTTRRAIGFEISFATIATWKELIKNIRIVSEDGKSSGIYSELYNDFPERKQWVAIGDSITEIDKNNGLSYVGYAQRKLGFKVDNQGKGGWTIYKLWRDRATAGWESAVSAINDGDLVTILAGTNDFDTDSLATPSSDEAMDAAGNPHPRFGTTDPTSEDAKDPHTTLGCLRLMIERILELKPGARLSVFSPFYREKGAPIGQTSWNKLYINSDGKTIYDYADAIYSVAREYNLPAYNTCRDCGINALTLTTYTYDDLHIGQLGGELIGDYVAKRIS